MPDRCRARFLFSNLFASPLPPLRGKRIQPRQCLLLVAAASSSETATEAVESTAVDWTVTAVDRSVTAVDRSVAAVPKAASAKASVKAVEATEATIKTTTAETASEADAKTGTASVKLSVAFLGRCYKQGRHCNYESCYKFHILFLKNQND